ncbi:MAG: signal peptidase I [Clostridiales bacterium]|nr:signal peptidase I [Clostridiales bacterium]
MKNKSFRNTIILIMVCLVVMGASFYVSRNLLVVFPVKGSSMEPTLSSQENVLLFRTTKLKYDDIIVFYVPHEDRYLVKRVIGFADDEIDIRYDYDKDCYHVFRNGKLVTEEYINEPMRGSYEPMTMKIPQGKIFYLGDNRNNSDDSHVNGALADVSQVQGVAFLKYKGYRFKFL